MFWWLILFIKLTDHEVLKYLIADSCAPGKIFLTYLALWSVENSYPSCEQALWNQPRASGTKKGEKVTFALCFTALGGASLFSFLLRSCQNLYLEFHGSQILKNTSTFPNTQLVNDRSRAFLASMIMPPNCF